MAGLTISQADYMINSGDIKPAFKKDAQAIDVPPFGVTDTTGGKSFTEMLTDSVKKVEDLQREADKSMINLATGKSENIHETMIAVNKAEIAYQLMTQIRNKAIDAYKEIMKMQI